MEKNNIYKTDFAKEVSKLHKEILTKLTEAKFRINFNKEEDFIKYGKDLVKKCTDLASNDVRYFMRTFATQIIKGDPIKYSDLDVNMFYKQKDIRDTFFKNEENMPCAFLNLLHLDRDKSKKESLAKESLKWFGWKISFRGYFYRPQNYMFADPDVQLDFNEDAFRELEQEEPSKAVSPLDVILERTAMLYIDFLIKNHIYLLLDANNLLSILNSGYSLSADGFSCTAVNFSIVKEIRRIRTTLKILLGSDFDIFEKYNEIIKYELDDISAFGAEYTCTEYAKYFIRNIDANENFEEFCKFFRISDTNISKDTLLEYYRLSLAQSDIVFETYYESSDSEDVSFEDIAE